MREKDKMCRKCHMCRLDQMGLISKINTYLIQFYIFVTFTAKEIGNKWLIRQEIII